jgi:hypothetical protein
MLSFCFPCSTYLPAENGLPSISVEQPSYDRAFKVLANVFPHSYAAFALGVPVVGGAVPLDRELPAMTRHVDSLIVDCRTAAVRPGARSTDLP